MPSPSVRKPLSFSFIDTLSVFKNSPISPVKMMTLLCSATEPCARVLLLHEDPSYYLGSDHLHQKCVTLDMNTAAHHMGTYSLCCSYSFLLQAVPCGDTLPTLLRLTSCTSAVHPTWSLVSNAGIYKCPPRVWVPTLLCPT